VGVGSSEIVDLALEVLRRVAVGEPAGASAESLAEAVLVSDPVRLARAVLAGGPHALNRAVELAEGVLGNDACAGSGAVGAGSAGARRA
jgi:hypothetical protein